MVGVALRVDVPLKHVMRQVSLLQNLDATAGREGEVSRVPDVGIDRGSHVTVSVVVPLPHIVTVEHPTVEEVVIVSVSCLPSSAQVMVGVGIAV